MHVVMPSQSILSHQLMKRTND